MATRIEINWDLPDEPLSDAVLSGRDWVMRYDLPFVGEAERRPVSMKPDLDGLYFVDHGTPLRPGRSSAALFRDGEWLRTNKQPWKVGPTHWIRTAGLPVVPRG